MKRTFVLAASIITFVVAAPAQEQKATAVPEFKKLAPDIELNDGDNFVFLGDSITHQCLYTQYVEDYFYTRFPAKRIHFHNSGVGGDRASDALARFDDDVAAFKLRGPHGHALVPADLEQHHPPGGSQGLPRRGCPGFRA